MIRKGILLIDYQPRKLASNLILLDRLSMKENLRTKIIEVCEKKIATKGPDVGLSFYAFFTNKMVGRSTRF